MIAVPLITVLASVVMLLWLLDQSERELKRESHAAEIHSLSNSLWPLYLEMSTCAASYGLTHNDAYKKQYSNAIASIRQNIFQLKELVKGDPEEAEALKRFADVEEEASKTLDALVDTVSTTEGSIDLIRARDVRLQLQTLAQRFSDEFEWFQSRIKEIEGMHAVDPSRIRQRARIIVMAFGVFTVVTSGILAFFFSQSITRRLYLVMRNSEALKSHQPLAARLRGRDEIAKLDQLFHQMASAVNQAAERERAITENAADIICSLSSDRKFVEINPACFAAWGYTPAQLIDQGLDSVIFADDRKATLTAFDEAVSKATYTRLENRIMRRDGSLCSAQWSLSWSNEWQMYFCTVNDITQRREIERLKKEFVAMVSHDLKSPLASLQGSLTVFETGVLGTLNEKGLKTIERSSDDLTRLINLIDGLLDIEKMEAGKMQMQYEELDLQSVVSRSVDSVINLARGKDIEIECPEESLTMRGDASKLVQVFVNLLSNAIKFSFEHTTINVSYKQTDDKLIEIAVKDQGRGIPEAHLESVFDRFKQVDKSDNKEQKGKGLGLAICKAIIDAHGGTISVQSKVGSGSTFLIRLPIREATTSAANESNESAIDA